MERLVGIEPTYVQSRILLPNPIGHRRIVYRLSHTWAVHDKYRLETVVLNTLFPLPSYLFSPRARFLLGLHVLGSNTIILLFCFLCQIFFFTFFA